MSNRYPLFPLPLQIFEIRYRRMVKECLASDRGFVMVMSEDPKHPDRAYRQYGTYAEISDWQPLPNQMIGIQLIGKYKVSVTDPDVAKDGLITGDIQRISESGDNPESQMRLEEIFKRLQQHPLLSFLPLKLQAGNGAALSYQLADMLPFSLADKQLLLEQDDPCQRLELILTLLKEYA